MTHPPTPRLVHADVDLARRLEALTAREMWRMARAARIAFPEREALAIDVAGGVAAYVGEGSPINEAFGMGFSGEVTQSDIDMLQRFYNWRGARGKVGVCPLADRSLGRLLGENGWVPEDFENVLVMALDRDGVSLAAVRSEPGSVAEPEVESPAAPDGESTAASGVDIRVCAPEERDLWARTVAVGFAAPALPTQAELDLARIIAAREEAVLFLAWVDGEPAGTGELVAEDGVGWLSADATLPQHRGRGIQRSMQLERVKRAREVGCDLVVTESTPGSASQRNMERLGFRIAYTRVEMIGPWSASAGARPAGGRSREEER